MIRTATLLVTVLCGRDAEVLPVDIPVYEITEGDHVWNTLVADRERDGMIEMEPCISYLKMHADEFLREYPAPLRFGSDKKAFQLSGRILRRPLNVRGEPYPVKYPGT